MNDGTQWVAATIPTPDGGTRTVYLGNIPVESVEALREHAGAANVSLVESLPYDLVSGEDCMYLVGTAVAFGLPWELSPLITDTPDGPQSSPTLRVYTPDGEILVEGMWQSGEWHTGSHRSAEDAVHYLQWYRLRKEAEKDA